MMNTKSAFGALGGFLVILLSLSGIADVAAQDDPGRASTRSGERLNIDQTVTLSEQVAQYGSRVYPITNVFSNWNLAATLPKSTYAFNFSLGGHLYNTGGNAGKRFGIYTSLLNSFDFVTVHRLSQKWSLTASDSFFYYPNINRYGYGSLLQYNTAVNNQVGALDNFRNFKINPFGAAGPPSSPSGTTALAAVAPSTYFPGLTPGFGYYGYYPIFLGSLTNDFAATLAYAINSKSTLDFTYDNSYMSFKSFGAFKSQSVTTQYSWQYNRKGSLSFAYTIGRYLFKEPVVNQSIDPSEPEPENDNPYRPGLTHTFTVGTTYQLTPNLGVEFSVGPSITTSNLGNTVYLDLTTLASLTKRFRKATVSAEYFRFVGSTYGYGGAALTQGAILTYARPLSRRLDWSASGTYFHFTDIFGIFADCSSSTSTTCDPETSEKQSAVSGAFVATNLHWRMTKRLDMNLGFTHFKGNARRIGFFLPGGFAPYGAGKGFYNYIGFAYPLRHHLTAFATYYFISSGLAGPSKSSYGNSVAVGISHAAPSIFKIGRR